MKQERPTYLKSIGKNKAFAATLSDIELEIESNDNNDEGILSAFTVTVDPIERVTKTEDDDEDLVVSKFEKWMNKLTSIQPMQNCINCLRSIRNYIS